MFISVVIPTYKRKEKLIQTLSSLKEQNFSKNDYEVIVVEDGSKDAEELVRNFNSNFKYYWQENAGPAKARNLGIKKAKGEIIAFTDDDCVVPKDWLLRLSEGFKAHPDVAGVGGYLEASEGTLERNIFARYERFVSRRDYGIKEVEMVGGFDSPAGGTNNVSYKKEILEEVGLFDETFPVAAGEDADLKWRITEKGYRLLFIPLKVEHHQDYNFAGFLRQAYNRGVGTYHFQKKWGKEQSAAKINFMMLYLPLRLFKKLLLTRNKLMSILEFFYLFQELRGEKKLAR